MLQQMQHPCNQCKGTGQTVNEKDRCPQCKCDKAVSPSRRPQCKGDKVVSGKKVLEVVVEKGMQNGQKITFHGEADEPPDTITGDIVCVVQQKDHPKFKRNGDDLFFEHTLSLTEALCGFQFVVTDLDKRKLLIKSNPGEVVKPGKKNAISVFKETRINRKLLIKSDPGEVVKPDQFKAINDKGMPMYQSSFMRGKLYIHFTVKFPESLTLDQVKAFDSVLPARATTKLTYMEVNECEETTMHNVNMKEELRRKRKQEAYKVDEEDNMPLGDGQRV